MTETKEQILHEPVLAEEMLDILSPQDGGVYIDATFGAGGYSRKILDMADCRVIAIDRDPDAEEEAKKLQAKYGSRFDFVRDNFVLLDKIVESRGLSGVDGIVMDLGVSSIQLDTGSRGFSFNKEGQLDMRMSKLGKTAGDIVNSASKRKLADIIYRFGEERKAKPIATAIEARRKKGKITTTTELANIVRSVVGRSPVSKIDPATKTFQALRIYVNDELIALEQALEKTTKVLNSVGKLIVVSFHGLEDKIVKKFSKKVTGDQPGNSRYYFQANSEKPDFEYVSRKAVKPSKAEIDRNNRARSARLRAIRKK
jgi:16S rRNA (cytosine1402-N4)-methyltransferase